eukprot:TRINITY_DN1968_c0_g2_i2.p1 TRINITY_DN1968_c0_g2~~TRINITY_DN1968_c0_g2_i2.p1  ORF type:complete len:436 (-),score=75.09 TRINITY_DN1968_c0_g2_i2:22-1329(-)
MEKNSVSFSGTLTVHVTEAVLPTAKEEFYGHKKFFPVYSISLVDEKGTPQKPPGVCKSKISKDRAGGRVHFTENAWTVKFPVTGATKLRAKLLSQRLVAEDETLQYVDFSLPRLLESSNRSFERVYTIGTEKGRACNDNNLPEIVYIHEQRETMIKLRVSWLGDTYVDPVVSLIDSALAPIQNKTLVSRDKLKSLAESFIQKAKGKEDYFTEPERLWAFLEENELIDALSSFDMFMSRDSIYKQAQEELTKDLGVVAKSGTPKMQLLFRLCDVNHDGKVEFKEVLMLLAAASDASHAEKAELAFSLLDSDASKDLSFAEILKIQQWNFMHVFHSLKHLMSIRAIGGSNAEQLDGVMDAWWTEYISAKHHPNVIAQMILDMADKDNNGTISREEYLAFMNNSGHQEVLEAAMRSFLVEIRQTFDEKLKEVLNKAGH